MAQNIYYLSLYRQFVESYSKGKESKEIHLNPQQNLIFILLENFQEWEIPVSNVDMLCLLTTNIFLIHSFSIIIIFIGRNIICFIFFIFIIYYFSWEVLYGLYFI